MSSAIVSQPRCLRRQQSRTCPRARLARAVTTGMLDRLPVRVAWPDGTTGGGGDDDAPVLELVRPAALFERLAHAPKIGFAEAYIAGDWRAADGTDLGELLTPFAQRYTDLVPGWLLRLRGLVDRRPPAHERNTVEGAQANIHAHYDLGNELFARFLDPSMTYSSALFDDAQPLDGQDLHAAQHRKIDAVLDLAGVTAGTRLLEIGTGWGALAIAAARRDAVVTTVTLSQAQHDLARERIDRAGLADRVDVRLQDYRHVQGRFDAIVSVEMIEAVGEEYWPAFFATLDRLLAPGGTVALQAILMDHDRLLASRRSYGWIQKHVFPGGLIPSQRAIESVVAAHSGLAVRVHRRFGAHYAQTLRRWRETFDAVWHELVPLGYDEAFRRRWELYLAYCEAGFASGYLDVAQLRLTRTAA